jgi:hypothetical protein
LTLPISAFHLSILSEDVGSLTSKLPSMKTKKESEIWNGSGGILGMEVKGWWRWDGPDVNYRAFEECQQQPFFFETWQLYHIQTWIIMKYQTTTPKFKRAVASR